MINKNIIKPQKLVSFNLESWVKSYEFNKIKKLNFKANKAPI